MKDGAYLNEQVAPLGNHGNAAAWSTCVEGQSVRARGPGSEANEAPRLQAGGSAEASTRTTDCAFGRIVWQANNYAVNRSTVGGVK